ncbi:hypothetical protein EMCRGX_G018560 [Ephydatia muelleri]
MLLVPYSCVLALWVVVRLQYMQFRNSSQTLPRKILQNTYHTSIRVVIPGNGEISSSEGTSQGDPLAMGMYALGVIPLIRTLTATCPQVHQVWYADDASGAGSCADLRVWWDALCSAGPNFGYHPNPSKTFLVTKPEHAEKAKQLFAGTNVSICAGKRCLGAAIGSKSFTEEYVRKKSVDFHLKDNVGHTKPISPFGARNSRISFTSLNRPPFMLQSGTFSYLALPVRFGGLGIANPTEMSAPAFLASVKLTAPLTSMIVSTGTTEIQLDYNLLQSLKRDINHGFHINKGEFRDALCLRYDWSLPNVPQHCSCGKHFSVDHAMTCHLGGFLTVRHNDIRDFTASLLTEVCHNVATEPTLQPLNGETFSYRTANTDAEARADIRARGFWSKGQDAYFDVRVFHPNASSYVSKPLSALFRTHEQAKKREYGQRIRDVEHGVFTPLVFSTSGAMGREATTFYKRLADLLSDKQDKAYSLIMGWLRCRLSFAILRSAIMCLRGSRSSYHHPVYCDLALAVHEGRVSL